MHDGLFVLAGERLAYAGRFVSEALHLRVKPGDRVALIGPSGAGKSTLLRALRCQHPDQVAWCPQQPGLVPMLSLFHNIYLGRVEEVSLPRALRELVWPSRAARAEVAALCRELGLPEDMRVPAEQLSGGQQSRVSLGRALFRHRPVFMGDEPVSALDEVMADELLGLVCARHETLIVALHDMSLSLKHFNRIVGIREGRIELDAPTRDVDVATLSRFYQA